MEDLTDAITSLKCLLEEQLDMKDYPMVEDSPFLSLTKEIAKMNKTLECAIDTASDLVNIMEDIKEIQERALKWQEMAQ